MKRLILSVLFSASVCHGQYITDYYTATTNEVSDGLNQTKPVTPWSLKASGVLGSGGTVTQTTTVNIEDSRFGGIGDGVTLYDAATTSGSPVVTSASATFTAADFGKWAVVYTDGYNTNYVLAQITNIISSSAVQLSSNALATASGMTMNYFSDNAAAIQLANNFCLSNGVGVIQFTNQSKFYGVVGSFNSNATYQASIITVPAQPVNPQYRSITFRGARPMRQVETGYSQAPASRIGSIIYCPSKATGTNCCLFGLSTSDGLLFSSFNYHFENLMILTPCDPKITVIQNWSGGGLEVKGCNITVDYGAGKVNAVTGERYAFGVKFAQNNNSGDQLLEDSEITQFGVGVQAQEHTLLKNAIVANCLVGVDFGFGTGVYGSMAEIVNNATNFVLSALSSGQVNMEGSWYVENCGSQGDFFFPSLSGFGLGGQFFVVEGCQPLKFKFATNSWQQLTNTVYEMKANWFGSQSGFLSQNSSFINGAAFSSGDLATDGNADLLDPFYIGGGIAQNNSYHHGLFHIQGFGGQDIWRMAGLIQWLSGNTQVASLDSSGNFIGNNFTGNHTGNGSGLTNLNIPLPSYVVTNGAKSVTTLNGGLQVSGDITLPDAGIFYTLGSFQGGTFSGDGSGLTNLTIPTTYALKTDVTNTVNASSNLWFAALTNWDATQDAVFLTTNSTLNASLVSGVLPMGTLSATTMTNGFLTTDGSTRSYSKNGQYLTNLSAANIVWPNLLTTNWALGPGWTNLADGSYVSTNTTGYNGITQYIPASNLVDGGVYWLKYYIATNTSGSIQSFFDINGAGGQALNSVNGAKQWACVSFTWNANAPSSSSTNQITIRCGNGWVGAIRNIGLYGPK